MFNYKLYLTCFLIYVNVTPGSCQKEVDIGYYRKADFQNATKINRNLILAGGNQDKLEDECLSLCKGSSFAAVKEIGEERLLCLCCTLFSKLFSLGSGEAKEKFGYKILNISVSDKQLDPSYYHATPFDKIYKDSRNAITAEPWQKETQECRNVDLENITLKLTLIGNNSLEFCTNNDADKNCEYFYDAIFSADAQNTSTQCELQCTLDSRLSNNLDYLYYTLTYYLPSNLVFCKCFEYKPVITNIIMCSTCINDQSQNCSIDTPTNIDCYEGTKSNNISTSTISNHNSNDDKSKKGDTNGSSDILIVCVTLLAVYVLLILSIVVECCYRNRDY